MIIAATRLSRPGQKSGFVLILILVLLVLVSLLVIGFLGHGLSQVKTVANYRAQTDSLLLSDVAVNLVKAQIDDATSQPASIWASQPGAIRTFMNNGSDATYGTTYKLYSSPALTSTAPQTDIPKDLPTTADPAGSDWNTSPTWTDLNAPVQKSDGTYAYPIIDAYNDPADLPGASFNTGSAMPASFSIAGNTVGAVTPLSKTTPPTIYPIPMPVQWLYILKQGQLIAPDSGPGTATTITFNSANPKPTAANPIVGRVAYWTDDDTCRVNINTASVSGTAATGGNSAINTFWDTPRFTAADDTALAKAQPYNLEYQRYPGHPAMTTLTLALPEFADPAGTGNVSTANMTGILALTPRYGTGGSNGATTPSTGQTALTFKKNSNGSPYRLYTSTNELLFNTPGVVTNTPRNLSVLTRQQLETAKFFITAHSRAPELNLFGMPRVAIWPISNSTGSQYRTTTDSLIAFCATNNVGTTANSAGTYYFTRQPFTSMTNPSAVIPLEGSNSMTWDVSFPRNISLLNYLDTLTSTAFPAPGHLGGGQSFDDKYSQTGMRQILTEIFDYIRITNSRDPGLDAVNSGAPPGSTPYSALTAYDVASEGAFQLIGTQGYGQIAPTSYAPWGTYGFGRFQGILVGAHIMFMGVGKGPPVGSPYAAGSYNAVNPFNIANGGGPEQDVFYEPPQSASAGTNLNNTYAPQASDTPAGTAPVPYIPPAGDTAVEAVICFTWFDPATGYARDTPWIHPNTTGLTTFTVSPLAPATVPVKQQLFLSDVASRLGSYNGNQNFDFASMVGANPASLGGLLDFRLALADRYWNRSVGDQYFCGGHSNVINMPTGGTFSFSGGQINVTVSTGYGTPGSYPVVHTYTLSWPSAILPVPGYSTRPIMGTTGVGAYSADRFSGANAESTGKDAGGYISTFIDFANDTIISMVPNAAAGYGDYRMLGQVAPATVPSLAFTAHPYYAASSPTATDTTHALTQSQRIALDAMYPSGQVFQASTAYSAPQPHGLLAPGASYFQQDTHMGVNLYSAAPIVPITQATAPTSGLNGTTPPDFDNGFGSLPDGPYINKADEGGVYPASLNATVYYDNLGADVAGTAAPAFFFSPQRQVPSPVMFGSLPTGVPVGANTTPKPWRTLLFQPGASGHFGLNLPKDEYLLDLFWMPQALPYAISEPFSTAGKVNLNYQILPFTYIDRSTAIQSVLASEKVAQVSAGQAGTYKQYSSTGGGGMATNARQPLNLSETTGTLRQFVQKFTAWSVFKAAAEICDVYLVPQNESWSSDSQAQSTWYGLNYALVGDNTREKPYADIYSRVTTKSNVYTVYYRVQTLKNPPGVAPTQWTEGTGVITGEFRGSTTIERYLDPNLTVPDYGGSSAATLSSNPSLDGFNPAPPGNQLYYKWRVVENSRFAP